MPFVGHETGASAYANQAQFSGSRALKIPRERSCTAKFRSFAV